MIPEIVIYLLKVNLALILFYLGYRVFLKKFTFYNVNRFYLLIGLSYSALYPLLDFNKLFADNSRVKQLSAMAPDWQGSISDVISQSGQAGNQFWQIPIIIFWGGVSILMIRLIFQLASLRKVHQQSEEAQTGNFTFRRVKKAVSPFSFWNNIYLNPDCHLQNEILPILEHEQVHVDQMHTLDVLLAEICAAFYWFNPGIWLMRNSIKANLEFITDQEVIRSGIDKKAYQYALLRINILESNNLPVNNFKIVSLKHRIKMINKKPSDKINLGSYMLIVPAILFFLTVVSVSQAALNPRTAKAMIAVLPDIQAFSDIISPLDTIPETTTKKSGKSTVVITSLDDSNRVVMLQGREVNSLNADTIKIRGNKPLYILDGREVLTIEGLNPARIQSINVLKGQNAIISYGSEGKDGVIEITTKGSEGITLDTNKVVRLRATSTSPAKIAVTGAQAANSAEMTTVSGYGIARAGKSNNAVIVTGRRLNSGKAETLTVSGYPLQKTEKVSLDEVNNALIILDGKEIDKTEMERLSVSQIGKIEILKGKSATDKYGDKGNQGVIQITTKK